MPAKKDKNFDISLWSCYARPRKLEVIRRRDTATDSSSTPKNPRHVHSHVPAVVTNPSSQRENPSSPKVAVPQSHTQSQPPPLTRKHLSRLESKSGSKVSGLYWRSRTRKWTENDAISTTARVKDSNFKPARNGRLKKTAKIEEEEEEKKKKKKTAATKGKEDDDVKQRPRRRWYDCFGAWMMKDIMRAYKANW